MIIIQKFFKATRSAYVRAGIAAGALVMSGCGGGGGDTPGSAAASASSAGQTMNWSIADLGTLGRLASAATSINDSGFIVGVACTLPTEQCDAFLTNANGGGIQFLDPIGSFSIHYAPYSGSPGIWINKSGQIFGNNQTASFMTAPLGLGVVSLDSSILGIIGANDSGQVAGTKIGTTTVNGQLYSGDLPFVSGPNGNGANYVTLGFVDKGPYTITAINNLGQVLGATVDGTPYITDENGGGVNLVDSGNLPIGANIGVMNDSAQVAGTIVVNNVGTGFVTGKNGVGMTSMGTAGAWPTAINASGQVVGPNFIYSHGILTTLTQLPAVSAAGWTSLNPLSINASSQIVGYGEIGGATHAFLLTPSH